MSESSNLLPKTAAGAVRSKGDASVAQRFPALEHAAENDLDAGRGAQALDPAVLVLAFDVARLVLVPARLAPARLRGGEPPGVRQPPQGLGLQPPARAERSAKGQSGLWVTLVWRPTALRLGSRCVHGLSLHAKGAQEPREALARRPGR